MTWPHGPRRPLALHPSEPPRAGPGDGTQIVLPSMSDDVELRIRAAVELMALGHSVERYGLTHLEPRLFQEWLGRDKPVSAFDVAGIAGLWCEKVVRRAPGDLPPWTEFSGQARVLTRACYRRGIGGAAIEYLYELIRSPADFYSEQAPPPPAGPDPAPSGADGRKAEKEAVAVGLLTLHPDWSNAQIAAVVGCHKNSLSRWERFKAFKATLKEARRERPRGYRTRDGGLEVQG
jgi:hypothetical protein